MIFSPLAYPGYNWMAQAVSDLSAETAPSRILWDRLTAFYGTGSVVCATCVAIYVSEERLSTGLFRTGIYLFAAMNWVSAVGYKMFPLADAGKEIASFQEVMHIVVTAAVVLLSVASLVILIAADLLCEKKQCDVSHLLTNVKWPLRWLAYYGIVTMILFSCNLSTQEFVYMQF